MNPRLATALNYSRHLRNRELEYANRSAYLTSSHDTRLTSSVQITMSFTGVVFDPANYTAAIFYWHYGERMWYEIAESCGESSHVDYDKQTVTGTFCGVSTSHLPHVDNIQFSLHIMSSYYTNTPPVLLTRLITTYVNEPVYTQLLYHDAEDDVVQFTTRSDTTEHGEVNVTLDGWLTYEPNNFYYGWDEIIVIMTEVDLISGIEPHVVETAVRIRVIEKPVQPVLFLDVDDSLSDQHDGDVKVFSDYIELHYEGNTTHKPVGTVYLCDFNTGDQIHLLYHNQDHNVTVHIQETSSADALANLNEDAVAFSAISTCIQSNVRVYKVHLSTELKYHGYDKVQLIGADDSIKYSQPIVLDVYSLVSPCGANGYCHSDHDPDCTSNERSSDFEDYECNCDTWHDGAWCDMLDVLKITFTLVGGAWLGIILVIGLVTYRSSRERLWLDKNRVTPIELDEMDQIPGSPTPEDTPEPSSDESESDTDSGGESLELKTVYPDGIPEKRYKTTFTVETKNRWAGGAMGAPVVPSVAAIVEVNKPKNKRKLKTTNKVKKNKVTPRA